MNEETLNLEQAADFLKLHPERLSLKARQGVIPGSKPGKRWVFLKSDLVEYLRSSYYPTRRAVEVDISEDNKCQNQSSGGKTPRTGGTDLKSLEREYQKALGY